MHGKGTAAHPRGHADLAADQTPGPLRSNAIICAPVPRLAARRGNGKAAQWPLRSFLELGPLPGAVPCARLHVRQVLWEWNLTGLSEATELVVSELLTNAVQASIAAGCFAPVRLWLLAESRRVLVLVWDHSPQPPMRTDVGDDAETGRGLLLVEAVSVQWNWHLCQDLGGKVVWAELAET